MHVSILDILSNSDFVLNIFWLILLIFARILGAVNMCALFTDTYFNSLLRNSFALVLSLILIPYYNNLDLSNLTWLAKVILLVSNFMCGSLIGFFMSLPIYAIESCGNIIDMQRGEQMGAIINQITKNPASTVGKLLSKSFMVYIIFNNGLLFFLNLVFNSFTVLPVNSLFPLLDLTHINRYLFLMSEYFHWVVVLALPLITIMFFVDIILGVVSAFIPQLNVTVLSMPIKSISALFVLSLYISFLFHNIFMKILIHVKDII